MSVSRMQRAGVTHHGFDGASHHNHPKLPPTNLDGNQSSSNLQPVSVEKILLAWIDQYHSWHNVKNLELLLDCDILLPYKPIVQNTIEINLSFQSNLINSFDNYVCFISDKDKRQLHYFYNSCLQNAGKAFKHMHPEANNWQVNFLKKLCFSTYSLLWNQNLKILRIEKSLAENATEKIFLEYKKAIHKYLATYQTNLQTLNEIHNRIKNHSLNTFESILDFQGRNNHVMETYYGRLLCQIEQYFGVIANTITNESSSTPLEINKKREEILKFCTRFRNQLDSKSIRLGMLMQKLVRDELEKHEKVARSKVSTNEQIMEAWNKIGVLRDMYGVK